MSYEEIVSLDAEVTTALGGFNKKTKKDNPTEVEGYYLGHRKVESKKAKSGFAYIHFFQTPKGNIGIWGKTDLDRKLLGVTPGTMTLAQFDSMVATPNGEMYKYTVKVDRSNTIEVAGLISGSNQDVGTDTASEGDTEYDSLEAADEQARVHELLNRGKAAKGNSLKK